MVVVGRPSPGVGEPRRGMPRRRGRAQDDVAVPQRHRGSRSLPGSDGEGSARARARGWSRGSSPGLRDGRRASASRRGEFGATEKLAMGAGRARQVSRAPWPWEDSDSASTFATLAVRSAHQISDSHPYAFFLSSLGPPVIRPHPLAPAVFCHSPDSERQDPDPRTRGKLNCPTRPGNAPGGRGSMGSKRIRGHWAAGRAVAAIEINSRQTKWTLTRGPDGSNEVARRCSPAPSLCPRSTSRRRGKENEVMGGKEGEMTSCCWLYSSRSAERPCVQLPSPTPLGFCVYTGCGNGPMVSLRGPSTETTRVSPSER